MIRNLGILLDNNLTFENQINIVCRNAFITLREISRKRQCLTFEATKTLVNTLVLSKINFCCTIYQNIPHKYINKLQKVQNYAARVITQTSKFTHVTPLLKQLNWLNMENFIRYRYATLVFKAMQNQAPTYLTKLLIPYKQNRTLRSQNNNLLTIPNIITEIGRRSFSYQAPLIWNSLPPYIKNSNTTQNFKYQIKQYLLNN